MTAGMKHAWVALVAMTAMCGVAGAQNIGTLVCTPYANGGGIPQTGPTPMAATTLKVSYFDVGLTAVTSIGSGTSGAGAGKVTFNPFTVHTALSNFDVLSPIVFAGTAFENRLLKTTTKAGSSVEFEFKLVAIKQLDAVGGDAEQGKDGGQTAYTSVQFEYGGLQVRTLNAQDNGGTGTTPPAGGWNVVTNKP